MNGVIYLSGYLSDAIIDINVSMFFSDDTFSQTLSCTYSQNYKMPFGTNFIRQVTKNVSDEIV